MKKDSMKQVRFLLRFSTKTMEISILNPYGMIEINEYFRKENRGIEVEPFFAMPDSVRLREVTWHKDFLFGRYTASLSSQSGIPRYS